MHKLFTLLALSFTAAGLLLQPLVTQPLAAMASTPTPVKKVAKTTVQPTQQWVLLPQQAKSAVRFTSDAPLELIQGETGKIQGAISVDPSLLSQAEGLKSITFTVDLTSLDTGIGLRNQHMRDNYLETGKYPTATFKVAQLTPMSTGKVAPGSVMVFKAKGPFTLHGKTVEKTIPVSVINMGNRLRIQSQFPVQLTTYGIPRPEIVSQKLADTLTVHLDLVAVPKVVAKK
jgi:polyisoprenoid-binding protein YceI